MSTNFSYPQLPFGSFFQSQELNSRRILQISIFMRKLLNLFFNPSRRVKAPDKGCLFQHPLPLYSPDHKLALFWSAKAGCTFAVKWFLYQTNELEMALAYDPWVHNYRENVFYQKSDYKKTLCSLAPDSTKILKMVRNPFSRAVSSYIMSFRSGYDNEEMSHFLSRKVDNNNGYSFEEFLDYLGTIDLRNCNIHHRLQVHPSEEIGLIRPDFIIHLEKSFEEMRDCERSLGLRAADLENFRASGHNTFRKQWSDYWGNVPFYRHLGSKVLPDTPHFYNDQTRRQVVKLYKSDFELYDYDQENVPGSLENSLRIKNPATLLDVISNQIPAVGPVHIHLNHEGYWKDSWCTDFVKFNFRTLSTITKIQFIIRLPGDLLHDNSLEITCGKHTIFANLSNRQDSVVDLPVSLGDNKEYALTIKSDLSRNCKELGISDDSRILSFYLVQMIFA